MINIKVEFLSILKDYVSEEEVSLALNDEVTFQEFLSVLIEKFGRRELERIVDKSPKPTLNNFILTALNGKDIRSLKGYETQIKDGDVISFMPAIAGG